MIDWTHIVVHHSATKDGVMLDFDNFRRHHTDDRGWRDVGYHYGVELVDQGYEVLVGRPLTMQGSHAPGYNRKGIGIVFAGNYNLISPPNAMLKVAIYRVIRPLMKIYSIPAKNIIGHRDTKDTDCPGDQFDLVRIRELL